MVGFSTKNLTEGQTLGEKLHQLRLESGLDFARLEAISGISQKYLVALEEGKYKKLPSLIYTKNYLRSYLTALEVKRPDEYLDLLDIEQKVTRKIMPAVIKNNKLANLLRLVEITPQRLRLAFIVVIIVACFSYLGWETKKIIVPPVLLIESPENNLITNKQIIEVRGQTEKEASLKINEQEIFVSADGFFSDEISLHEGLNTIKISANKKYSSSSTTFRQVLVVGSDELKQTAKVK